MSQKRPIVVEELLEWTYRRQRADVVIGRGIGLFAQEREMEGVEPHGRSMEAAVMEIAALGVRVDGGGRAATDCHPDAEIVHRTVSALDDRQDGVRLSALLIAHAKAGSRPDPMDGVVPRPVARRNQRGRALVMHAPEDRSRNHGYCPIDWSPSPRLIVSAAREFVRWQAGLRLVALALHAGGRLTMWYPLAPGAQNVVDGATQDG